MAFPCKNKLWWIVVKGIIRCVDSILSHMAIICCCAHALGHNMWLLCGCDIVIVTWADFLCYPMFPYCLYAILSCSHGIPMVTATGKQFLHWKYHVNCDMPRHSHGDSMWGRPVAKSCKTDIESHVNARFLISGNMGFPCSPSRGVCRFRGFGYMAFPCKEPAKGRGHGIPM